MSKIVFIVPPFSGEGMYTKDNYKRRPFDFVTVNIAQSILEEKYELCFYDFDIDGVLKSDKFQVDLENAICLIIYITEGHVQHFIDGIVDEAPCPTLVIGPGALRYENKNSWILVGEPEFKLLETVEKIQNKAITGGRKEYITEINNLDILPYSNHSNLQKLKLRKGYPSVLVSRGCNNSCTFCHSNDYYIPGKRCRRNRTIQNICDEIVLLKNKGTTFVHLECETFTENINDAYTIELLKALQDININYSTFFNVSNLIDIHFVQRLYRSGCRFVFIGIESSDDEILKKFNKPHNSNFIKLAIDNLNKVGIQFGIGFLPFNPFTTRKSLYSDMQFLYELVLKEYSHPLNFCSFINYCSMKENYSLELSVENLYQKFNDFYNAQIKNMIEYYEQVEHIYPERYVEKSVSIDKKKIFKRLLMLCKENESMLNIQIHKLKKENCEFIHQLMNNEHILAVLNEIPTTKDDWANAMIEWSADPDEENYIVYDENKPIGWLGLNGLMSTQKEVYIKVIVLEPSYQNKGIGAYVIHEISENLRQRGFLTIGLYTDQNNKRAQSCYCKCDFVITEKIIQKMSNGKYVRRYKMKKSLC